MNARPTFITATALAASETGAIIADTTRRHRPIIVEPAPNTGMWRIRIDGGGHQPFGGELFSYTRALAAVAEYKTEK